MTMIPVALEMFSVRKEFTENPLACMRAVKEMGYTGVEFAGDPEFSKEFYAALLKETGLVCCGWHTYWESVQEDTLEKTIELNQAVGNSNIIVPWLNAKTLDDWKTKAQEFNELAVKLAPLGMHVGYHNHHHEFAAPEGKSPWDTFMENTDPAVIMQLDLGNALEGGCDIMATLNRYPGRCRTIHLKPYNRDVNGSKDPIGQDDIDWKAVFDFCKTKGRTEWYIVEFVSKELPPFEAVKQCLDGINAIRG